MKKIVLTIAAITCMALSSHSQILNGGFENWTSGLPDNWWGLVLPPYNLLSQTTSAHSGSYAVKLHVDSLSGQPISTPLSTGNGVVTTHPLSFVPLSVSFWYKLNAVGGDDLTITALVYSGGTGSGVAAVAYPAAANYTHIITPIMYGVVPAYADSIALIFVVTNTSGTSHIGTDAYIDDVSVSATTGIAIHQAGNDIRITPDPADNYLTVELPLAVNKTSEAFIADATGRQVYRANISGAEKEFTIATQDFKPGVYYCTVKSGDTETRKPVVIIHQ